MDDILLDPGEVPADLRDCFEAVSAACGAPWARVVERERQNVRPHSRIPGQQFPCEAGAGLGAGSSVHTALNHDIRVTTTGWAPTCTCDCPDTRPCVVLDPFAGSSTTLLVARQLGRIGWGAELQPDYVAMSMHRLRQAVLL
jgi:hypothetical protein